MSVAVRFAPSPTGFLHVGNVRSAILNWLFARKAGGNFLLRLDDTDDTRSTEEFAQAIQEDLAWLGLNHDRMARQSDRLERYRDALDRMAKAGLAYPCYETAEDLEIKRKLQLARGKPPIYDRAALKLTDADRAKLEAEGKTPHWRFKLSGAPAVFDDLIRGHVSIDTASLSDPVLVRADGRFLYLLASVVDDIDLGITHIIRGEDHVTNSAVQVEMFKALGTEPPKLAHYALLTGAGGEGLSKRDGSLALRSLRADGIEAMAILALIARLGTSDAIVPVQDVQALIEGFDLTKLSRAPARFDPEALETLNAKYLHHCSFDHIQGRLAALGLDRADEAFWEAVKPNLNRLGDAKTWWAVLHEGPAPHDLGEAAWLAGALDHLPAGALDETTGPTGQSPVGSIRSEGQSLVSAFAPGFDRP